MSLVADKKKPGRQPTPAEEVPEPKRAAGRSGSPVNVWVDHELRDALDAFVESLRPKPTVTAVVEDALEAYLKAKGFWPYKPPTSDD